MADEKELEQSGSPAEAKEEQAQTAADGTRAAGGPMTVLLPPDPEIWKEARKLVGDPDTRVESLALCVAQDPAIVMELLRTSNAMFFAGSRSQITSAQTAIVRLGSQTAIEVFDKINERPQLEDDDVEHWYEVQRSKCRRNSIIARVLAEALAKPLADDTQTAGLLMSVGEMLAVAHFRSEYVKLAEEHSRSGVNYRLAQDYKFDVETMGLNYLRRNGIPETLLFAIDRDGRARTPDRAIMKPLCMAAVEMVEAFDNGRWEKLAPGKKLPPKSAIRMLPITDPQYLKIYERASEYLFAIRQDEDKKKQAALLAVTADAAGTIPLSNDQSELASEIENIMSQPSPESDKDNFLTSEELATTPARPSNGKQTSVSVIQESIPNVIERFSLKAAPGKEKVTPRVRVETVVPIQAPKLRTSGGSKALNSAVNIVNEATNSEALLANILDMLIQDGLFEKSALIVVSGDRKLAIVVAARGPNIGNGQRVVIEDPLSPLAQCFAKVQSYGNKASSVSPFGSKAYAVSPVDADHDTPVALYADCGNNASVPFEARRIFRNVVEILNQKLPQLPGGIPVELGGV